MEKLDNSPFVLHSLLPQRDFICWCDFVEACQLLCQPILRKSVMLINSLYSFVSLLNTYMDSMHMMCHLQDILLDYGPVHGFWCFSFERYNAILEAMNKSWIIPEKQKFLDLQPLRTLDDISPNSTRAVLL